MTRSLPLTLDTISAALMVRGTPQPAIPKSHDQEEEREVIHQHHDHPASAVDNIQTAPHEEKEEVGEKPHSPHHHTKINSILHNELLDQLHQSRHEAIQIHGKGSMDQEDLVSIYSSRKEITLGICAAFSVFLIIVLVFVVRGQRGRLPAAADKETLIDNEADVGFLPPPQSSFMDSETQTTVHV